jgi:DNA-directed RNA polymerase subunit M/transcription elongation factor TFIIS
MNTRDIESAIHSISTTYDEYIDKSQQIILNLKNNPNLRDIGINFVVKTDTFLSRGTIIEDIEQQTTIRRTRFEQMLQEKYELMNDKSFNTTLRCRRCGSSEVSWEQKQTRSADEASTVFCTCNKCNNRWTMK